MGFMTYRRLFLIRSAVMLGVGLILLFKPEWQAKMWSETSPYSRVPADHWAAYSIALSAIYCYAAVELKFKQQERFTFFVLPTSTITSLGISYKNVDLLGWSYFFINQGMPLLLCWYTYFTAQPEASELAEEAAANKATPKKRTPKKAQAQEETPKKRGRANSRTTPTKAAK